MLQACVLLGTVGDAGVCASMFMKVTSICCFSMRDASIMVSAESWE